MTGEQKLALLLARLVELLRVKPDSVDDHKAAVRALCEMTGRRSWTARLEGPGLSVEGVAAPPETPLVPQLVSQMRALDVTEIQIAHSAGALDLMHLARALAAQPGSYKRGDSVARRLQEAQVRRVRVLGTEGEKAARDQRAMRVTEALRVSGVVGESGKDRRVAALAPEAPLEVVAAADGAAYEELIAHIRASRISLGAAVKRMRHLKAGAQLSRGLNAVAEGVVKAVRESRAEEAIEAIIAVIHMEEEATQEEIRIAHGVALRRMLGSEILRPMAKLLLDPLYLEDLMVIMDRAGSNATQLLLDLLVTAPTFAERRAYMAALARMGEGTDNVVAMLSHHEWYVVRNVADLIAELRLEEAVPALGKVVDHEDERVRRSVGIALARIGTPVAARHLRTPLHDPDPTVRLAVAKETGGAGLSGLVMPLVNAVDTEEVPEVREEFLRALGRIGTPEAVQALERASKQKGKLFGQRASSVRRAAVEGLALAGGVAAKDALHSLEKDRDREVRDAARSGLQSLTSEDV